MTHLKIGLPPVAYELLFEASAAGPQLGNVHGDLRVMPSAPFHDSFNSGLALKTSKPVEYFRFLEPFSPDLYVLIFGFAFVCAAMYILVDIVVPTYPRPGVVKTVYSSVAALFHGEDYLYVTWPSRIIRIGMLLVVVIVNAHYTANLTVFLSAPSTRVHGPTDLGSLRTSTVCVTVPVTVPGRFMRAAEFAGTVLSASFDEIGDTAQQLNMPKRQLWVDHMLDRELLSSLHLAPIQWGFVGLPARRETLANLSVAMSEYASSPAFVEVRSRYFGDGEVCAEEAPEATPIRAQMMAGVFIIFVGTCALAILVALIQRGCCPPTEHRGNPYGGATDGEILRTLLAKVDALAADSEGVRVDSDHMSLGAEPFDPARGVGPRPTLMRKLTQPLSMVRLGPIVNAKKLILGGGLMSKQMRSMDVTLVRRTPDETLGLGIGYDGPNSTFLLSIKPGSPAERCGALKLGDEIIAVNGTKLSPRIDFHELLASAGIFVTLTILRAEDASPGAKSGAAVEAAAMREIQVTLVKRNPQESLGLGVGFNASGATVLASMKPGSPAERCAALQLNDQIVAVGGQPISADTDFKTLLASTPIANLKVTLTILRSAKSPGFVDDGGTINVQKRYLQASENSIPEGFEGSPERAHMPANLIDTDVVQRGAPTP
ncbi:hypothetical protein Ctob_015349, partial [Chrysochromulina tobinii]